MRVIDPGHKYEVHVLDNKLPDWQWMHLTFVKRLGDKYPGNRQPAYPGTNIQDVCRVLIDRLKYLHNQEPHWINPACIVALRVVMNLLEYRAAKRHNRLFRWSWRIETMLFHPLDGHVRYKD